LEVLLLSQEGAEYLTADNFLSELSALLKAVVENVRSYFIKSIQEINHQSYSKQKPDPVVSAFKDSNGMAREYFTLIGTLSGSQRGWSLLKKDLFGWLSALAQQGEEDLRSAALTCLDYSKYVYTLFSLRLHPAHNLAHSHAI